MKKSIYYILFAFLISQVLVGCSASNFTQRKYTDGHFFAGASKTTKTEKKETAKQENTTETTASTTEKQKTTQGNTEVKKEVKKQNPLVYKAEVTFNKVKKAANKTFASKDKRIKNETKTKKQNQKANKKSATEGGGKSQLVALLLCIFIGVLGIHRFYLGYIGIGIIQIITLGGCGIWALIDLIMIITGDLKPKGGDYDTKF